MTDHNEEYINYLKGCVADYLKTLEGIFGPPDSGFEFGEIGYSHGGPETHFPDQFHSRGGCRVNIHISTGAWERRCRGQGAWQVAHECVHLLDPGKHGTTNVLEEGLATWFQNTPCYHGRIVQNYIAIANNTQRYHEAQDLVFRYGNPLREAIKKLRSQGRRIRDIDALALGRVLPGSCAEDRERLCSLFDNEGSR